MPAILLGLGIILLLLLLIFKQARRRLLTATLVLLSGVVIGNIPLWGSWFFSGIRPSLVASSGSGDLLMQLKLFYEQILPAFWGIPPFSEIPAYVLQKHATFQSLSIVQMALWSIIVLIILAVIIYFIYSERKVLLSVITLSPISNHERYVMIFGLLFFLPMIVIIFTGNAKDMFAVRYLISSWQAWVVISALFFSYLLTKRKIIGYIVIGLWIIVVGFGNISTIGRFWYDDTSRWFEPQTVANIEDYLVENNIQGGYSSFWSANALTFLMSERLIFTQFNGVVRFPENHRRVADLSNKALIFCPHIQMPDSISFAEVIAKLREGVSTSPTLRSCMQDIESSVVINRRTIAGWSIWLLGEES